MSKPLPADDKKRLFDGLDVDDYAAKQLAAAEGAELRRARDKIEELHQENEELKRRIAELEAAAAGGKRAPRKAGAAHEPDKIDTSVKGIREASVAAARDNLDEALYQAIRRRLLADPAVLRVLATKPEIRVEVTREVIDISRTTLRGRLAELVAYGFFKSPATGNAAYNELQRRGFSTAKPNVYRELDKLAELGFVTKEEGGFQAVEGMLVNIVEGGRA